MRNAIVMLSVDDNRAIEEDLGTLDYIEREFGWVADSGIYIDAARILDDDDEEDVEAIELANQIFNS